MSNYRLMQGDCIELLQQIPDNSIDLIVTDPPYGIDYSTYRTHSHKLINDDGTEWFKEVAKEFARVLKLGSHIYCFTDVEMLPDFIFKLRENGFKIRNLLAIPRAVKGNGGNRIFQQQFEYCIFATLGKANQGRNFEETQILKPSEGYLKDKRYKAKEWLYRLPDYWYWTKASVHNAKNKLHPTQKNVSCLKDMISLSSKKGEVVLDCFMGSGSTGVASLGLGRKFIGMELDEHYFKVARSRIEKEVLSMSNYRLMQGDCIELLQHLPDNSIDLIVTDPPYEHVMGGMKSKKYNVGTWKADSYINMKMSQFKKKNIFCFLDTAIPKMKKVNMFVFCSRLQLAHYFDYLNQHKKLKYDLLVWDKSSKDNKYSMKSSMFYTSDIEYVLRIYESGVHLFKVLTEDKSKSDYRYYMKRQKFAQPKGLHESMKPVELLERYIKVSTNKGDTVLDCFMGSGSTGVAALNLNRRFVGIELDEHYFDTATKRIEEINAKVVAG